jgi:hypothetical protein
MVTKEKLNSRIVPITVVFEPALAGGAVLTSNPTTKTVA